MTKILDSNTSPVAQAIRAIAAERIVIIDGAMGTQIQDLRLGEADFRGERFADWPQDLKGNNDLLVLTQPDAIRQIHENYLLAGADIVETNTFSSTSIAQDDYGMSALAHELNVAGARCAREACERVMAREPGRQCFVAGAIGPTNKTASISPDVTDPAYRAATFDDLARTYGEAARGLIEGGADLLLVETIFDTLNAKAAIYAILEAFDDLGVELPIMISGTITDLSGRTLSGQTPDAFWHSVRHARPLAIGLNCALGAKDMRQHIDDISLLADTLVCAYPNAGLPNEFGEYDETADTTASLLSEFADSGIVNMLGGCCGTTPDHIRAIAEAVKGKAPRAVPTAEPHLRLSGLEPLTATPELGFMNVGERTNVTGSAKFRKLITADDYDAGLDIARQQVENGAQIIDVNMDEGHPRFGIEAMVDVPESPGRRARHRPGAHHDRLLPVVEVLEAGLKCHPGQGHRQLHQR